MERKYIYGGVALVVIIFILFLIMRNKGTDSSSSPGDVGPTIEVGDLQGTQNPDKSDNTTDNTKTSSYMIKKTEGYDSSGDTFDDTELSKNIQLGLTWSNGGGWDEIDTIKVKWEQKVTDSDDNTKTINKVRMTKEINKSTANANYFSQYMSGLTHTFTANDGLTGDSKFSAVGENMIHVYYIDKNKNNEEVRLTPDDVATFVVTVDMLSATKDLLSAKTYTYKPTTGTATISATIAETEYYLYNNAIKTDMISHIKYDNVATPGTVVLLPEGESANNSIVRLKVKFKNANGTNKDDGGKYFLKRNSDGKIIIEKDTTTFTEAYKFEVVSGTAVEEDQEEFVRFRHTDSSKKDKFMMVDFGENGDKNLKIKSYTTIDDACTNKSLDFILSSTKQSDRAADCTSA
jgi:hypothetical protein